MSSNMSLGDMATHILTGILSNPQIISTSNKDIPSKTWTRQELVNIAFEFARTLRYTNQNEVH